MEQPSKLVMACLCSVDELQLVPVEGLVGFLESTPVEGGWKLTLILRKSGTDIQVSASAKEILPACYPPPEQGVQVILILRDRGTLGLIYHYRPFQVVFPHEEMAQIEKLFRAEMKFSAIQGVSAVH